MKALSACCGTLIRGWNHHITYSSYILTHFSYPLVVVFLVLLKFAWQQDREQPRADDGAHGIRLGDAIEPKAATAVGREDSR